MNRKSNSTRKEKGKETPATTHAAQKDEMGNKPSSKKDDESEQETGNVGNYKTPDEILQIGKMAELPKSAFHAK